MKRICFFVFIEQNRRDKIKVISTSEKEGTVEMYENDSDNDDIFKIDDTALDTQEQSRKEAKNEQSIETNDPKGDISEDFVIGNKSEEKRAAVKPQENEAVGKPQENEAVEIPQEIEAVGRLEEHGADNYQIIDETKSRENANETETGDKEGSGENDASFEFDAGKFDADQVANMTEYEPQGIVEDSQTLLQAARSRNTALVTQILNKCRNLKVDLPDEVGKTVLHHLCNTNNSEEVRLCIQKGCDFNSTDKMGWTPLHYACTKGHKDVVEVLVGMGASCNISETQSKRTPLHVAVSRRHRDIVNLLLLSGADPTMVDKDGKSILDVCKSSGMSDLIEDAVETFETQDMRNIERMQIEPNKETPFLNLGITVKHVLEGDISTHQQPFSMRLQRSNDMNNLAKYNLKDSEDLCSDEFILKLRGTKNEKEINIELGISLISGPSVKEEMVFKTDTAQEILVDNIREENNKFRGTVFVNILSFTSFVVVSRPKLEMFEVGDEASTLKSAVDDRVELAIEAGTFEKKVTISMEITEPPPEEELKSVLEECQDMSSTSAFYSFEAGDTGFTKPIAVKIPLPQNYSGKGTLVILSMDKAHEDEKPEYWKPLEAEAVIVKGRIEFTVSSFSIKVAMETIRPISRQSSVDSFSDFGSQVSLLSQVSKIYRKSRRREFNVKIFSATRRQGTSNTFRLVTECCKEDQMTSRIEHWEGEGFNLQGNFQELENKPPIVVNAKQKFTLKPSRLEFLGNEPNTTIEFHPKKENNYADNTVKISEEAKVTHASVSVYQKHKGMKGEEGEMEPSEENVADIEITLYKFHPDMLRELDGKSFLTYDRMMDIQNQLGDLWWKVLVLLDIPFSKIEQTMAGGGRDVKDKINGLLFEWRESKRGEKSRGIPDLLSALARSKRAGVVHKLRKLLVKWRDDEQNRTDGFYDWLENAYRYNLVLPTKRTKPMSDQYFAMLADLLKPTEELIECLGIDQTLGTDILRNNRSYPTPEMKTMKILVTLRGMTSGPKAQMIKLLRSLNNQQLTEAREYAIMWTKAWVESPKDTSSEQTDEDEFRKLLEEIMD